MRYDLLIFDWDGTLLNSVEHIVHCMRRAFIEMNLTVPADEAIRDIIGLGMQEAILTLRDGATDEEVRRIRQIYGQHFFQKRASREDLFEGAVDLLDWLGPLGYQSAIATGKSRPGMDRVLKDLDMAHYFQSVRCADETRSKPNPMMLQQILVELDVPVSRALMIGDTEYDMKMAEALGMDRVGVSYGVHGVERLKRYSPIHIASSLEELKPLVQT